MPFIAGVKYCIHSILYSVLIFYLYFKIGSLGTKDSDVPRDKQVWKSYGWPKITRISKSLKIHKKKPTCALVKDYSFHKIHLSITALKLPLKKSTGRSGLTICSRTAEDNIFWCAVLTGSWPDLGQTGFLTLLLLPAVSELSQGSLLSFIHCVSTLWIPNLVQDLMYFFHKIIIKQCFECTKTTLRPALALLL